MCRSCRECVRVGVNGVCCTPMGVILCKCSPRDPRRHSVARRPHAATCTQSTGFPGPASLPPEAHFSCPHTSAQAGEPQAPPLPLAGCPPSSSASPPALPTIHPSQDWSQASTWAPMEAAGLGRPLQPCLPWGDLLAEVQRGEGLGGQQCGSNSLPCHFHPISQVPPQWEGHYPTHA